MSKVMLAAGLSVAAFVGLAHSSDPSGSTLVGQQAPIRDSADYLIYFDEAQRLHDQLGLRESCVEEPNQRLSACFSDAMRLAETLAEEDLFSAPSIVISPTGIFLDGKLILELEKVKYASEDEAMWGIPDSELEGQLVVGLFDELEVKADRLKRLGTLIGAAMFRGQLQLNVQEDIPFELVRQVMYTGGQAQFGEFQFVGINPWENALTGSNTTMPAIGEPQPFQEMEEDWKPPLQLSVVVTESGFDVRTNDAELQPEINAEGLTHPCAFGGECEDLNSYNWRGLNEFFARLKEKHPESLTILVAPEGDVGWNVIHRTIDYARHAPFLSMDASQPEWKQWTLERQELFSAPVIAGGTALLRGY